MIGTITYILARAGWRAMNGQITDERRRLAGAEPPAVYVSYDPRLLAGVGWYGYRIAFKGGDRQMIERARYMLSERYTIRDGYEYFSDGVYVIGVLLRQRVPHYGTGGGVEPAPEPDALNFYMPNGGTISLNKTGSPTVVELECSLDGGQTWTVWQPDSGGNRSLTLSAGQRMYVRNTSETQTKFSASGSDYYTFAFTDTVYAHGNTNSLLCKNAYSITSLTYACYFQLFYNCNSLVTAPELPAANVSVSSYAYMFINCTSLVTAPDLPDTTLAVSCYMLMFYGCISLREIRTMMTDISATSCLDNWLGVVAATGDFYCPASLTIPVGASGIPSGWTRHNIDGDKYLNFTMPNGGTISLNKIGSPTVVELEYLIEGTSNWVTWTETNNARTLTLTGGQKVYIRNTSETQTRFSTNGDSYYQFIFTATVYAHGNINSLLCKNAESVTTLGNCCYNYLFYDCNSLVTAPELPAITVSDYCYNYMFARCTSLTTAPKLNATALDSYCYYSMFSRCTLLQEVRTQMTNISADNCLTNWLYDVSPTGDFYCPAELTIPTGANGIPSGWTRHDI